MQRLVAKIYGIVTAVLGLLGLTMGGAYIFGVMNTDLALDWIRLILAVLLLYAGFISEYSKLTRIALWAAGAIFVALGLVGLLDSRLAGLAPSGFTIFDAAAHLVSGLFAIAVAAKKETRRGTPVDA